MFLLSGIDPVTVAGFYDVVGIQPGPEIGVTKFRVSRIAMTEGPHLNPVMVCPDGAFLVFGVGRLLADKGLLRRTMRVSAFWRKLIERIDLVLYSHAHS